MSPMDPVPNHVTMIRPCMSGNDPVRSQLGHLSEQRWVQLNGSLVTSLHMEVLITDKHLGAEGLQHPLDPHSRGTSPTAEPSSSG